MGKRRSLQLLFVSDPLAYFNPQRETTLYLMQEAARRGHGVTSTTPARLFAKEGSVFAHCDQLKIAGKGRKPWYQVMERRVCEVPAFDAVLLRKDPPFDQDYLHHLYLLDLVSKRVYMMNHPRGILEANEKIFPLLFRDFTPATLISADFAELENFFQTQPRGIVIKPLGSSGGRGVFVLRPQAQNFRVILESVTQEFTRHVVAQAYVPAVRKGDKRIMLLGQEALGWFMRRPMSGEHRANLHAGGSAHPASLQARDRRLVAALKPSLAEKGLDFVGIDVIGGYLTEVNVTSPMGLAEMEETGQPGGAPRVLDFLEKKLAFG